MRSVPPVSFLALAPGGELGMGNVEADLTHGETPISMLLYRAEMLEMLAEVRGARHILISSNKLCCRQ